MKDGINFLPKFSFNQNSHDSISFNASLPFVKLITFQSYPRIVPILANIMF